MEQFWICSACGSSNSYPETKKCEVCGKEIDKAEIDEAEKNIKKVAHDFEELKKREAEDKQRRIKEQKEAERKKAEKEKQIKKQEKAKKHDKTKEKAKDVFSSIGYFLSDYTGVILTSISLLLIIVKTFMLSSTYGSIPDAWIMYLIFAVLSIGSSSWLYYQFEYKQSKECPFFIGVTNSYPAAIAGALVTTDILCYAWERFHGEIDGRGFFGKIFVGALAIVIISVIAIVAILVTVGITQILPLFGGRTMIGGGLIGLGVTVIGMVIYFHFIHSQVILSTFYWIPGLF